ncbi:MAG TPA: GyrI-like domain-containing protein [Acidothermaceae bacterium]
MKTYQIEQRQLASATTAVVRSSLLVGEIPAFMRHAFGSAARILASQGISLAGPPFARYDHVDGDRFIVEAGFPTTPAVTPTDDVLAAALPAGPAAVLTYVGPYDEMKSAYEALAEWIVRNGGTPAGSPWEIYFTDPAHEPDPQKWRTEIVMPFHRPDIAS